MINQTMQVNIQSIHFLLIRNLKTISMPKLSGWTTFYDQIIQADVYLKLENERHPYPETKWVEVPAYPEMICLPKKPK